MSIHNEILQQLVDRCVSIHEECGVVLIGSVARNAQRSDSDLDLNIIFPRDEYPADRSPWSADDNRWQLQLKEVVQVIRIDVAWETQQGLLKRLNSEDAINCWPFANGTILRDPCDVAGPCLEIAKKWFSQRPEVASRFEQQYTEAKRKQLESRKRDHKATEGRSA